MESELHRWMAARHLVDSLTPEQRGLLGELLTGKRAGDMVETMRKQAGDPPRPDMAPLDLVRMAEVRYALGRGTAAPGLLARNLADCWDRVGVPAREAIVSEVRRAIADGGVAAAPHVVGDWEALLERAGRDALPLPA